MEKIHKIHQLWWFLNYEPLNPFPAAVKYICLAYSARNKYICFVKKLRITPQTNIFVQTLNSSRPVINACAACTHA